MSNEMTQQLITTAERLAAAAESLDRVLAKLDAQQESLNAKVDRIVAAVEDLEAEPIADSGDPADTVKTLQERVETLVKANEGLKAQATRMSRKTLSPLTGMLLSKSMSDGNLDPAALDKTLEALSVEQRIAVKAEMARAGMIE